MTNHDEFDELEYLRQELTDCGADLYAATTENADLRARLQTCQELSGGVLPMSDNAVKAGRFLLGILLTLCVSSSMGRRHSVHLNLSTEEAAALADALSPLFGDAGAAIKEK